MKFFDRFKKSKMTLEELEKSPIMTEKWMEHYFKLPLHKPENKSHEEFWRYLDELEQEVLSVVLGQMAGADSIELDDKTLIYKGSLKKNATITSFHESGDLYYMLLRFVDKKEGDDDEKGLRIRYKSPSDKREYKFSPIDSLLSINILPNIEFGLMAYFKFEQGQSMTYLGFDDNQKPIVTDSDGVQYFAYPFEKRVQLYQEHPEIERKLFGMPFKEFIDWILEKRGDNDHMKKYCSEIEKILKNTI